MGTRSPVSATILVLALVLLAPAAPASAQLTSLPGLTPPQRAMAETIQNVCPRLAVTPDLNAPQRDLLTECTKLVTNSIELSPAGLADALGRLTPEQAATQGSVVIETRSATFRVLAPRLAALRRAMGRRSAGPGLDAGEPVAALPAFDGEPSYSLYAQGAAGAASTGPDPGGRLGPYLNLSGTFGDRDRTAREEGFDFHGVNAVAGADYRFTDSVIAGAALSFTRTDVDLNLSLGDVEVYSYGVAGYGTYYVGDFYLDGYAGFTWNTYDTTRRIVYPTVNRTARGDTDGQQYTVNAGAGYDFVLGGFTVSPLARAEFVYLHIDGFRERGATGLDLLVASQDLYSLQSMVGAQVSRAISLPFGVLVPQVRGEWRHEFLDNDQSTVRARYANDPFRVAFTIPTDDPDRDYFALGAGVSTVFRGGVSAFLNYETFLGLARVTYHNLTAGIRFEF